MSKIIELPPKRDVIHPEDAGKLEAELSYETCVGHPLHSARVQAVYWRYPHDDVLFKVFELDFPYYCVHLTWHKEATPLWPYIMRFISIEDFCENYQMTNAIDVDDPRWETERWRFFEEA